ncbi:MAG: purine-binding chemotaxis protein CheW [Opitutae bacterium]|nr:purine-binding chemotaxis protein CheW [Opitutae bacterium]
MNPTSTSPAQSIGSNGQDLAGKYLTFVVGQQSYGLPVLQVREIIRLLRITPVPQLPAFVRGVVNLRGRVIPVMDLRVRLGIDRPEDLERTCIIVTQVSLGQDRHKASMGMVVDAVEEVVNIAPGDIDRPPAFGNGVAVSADFILGMGRIKGAVKTLLDLDRVVADESVLPSTPHSLPV